MLLKILWTTKVVGSVVSDTSNKDIRNKLIKQNDRLSVVQLTKYFQQVDKASKNLDKLAYECGKHFDSFDKIEALVQKPATPETSNFKLMKENFKELSTQIEETTSFSERTLTRLNEDVHYQLREAASDLEVLNKGVEKINKGIQILSDSYHNNFLSVGDLFNHFNYNFKSLYDFLDTLNLIQLVSTFHTLILMLILLNIFRLFNFFFYDELIKYFNLEKKYPRLAFYFKIRAKISKVSVALTFLFIIFICLWGISLNLLILGS
uniref:Uncharacterized protein n=1 Tax=Termitomyces sp. T132 TaxID=2136985 RepID=A0A2R4A3V6_9AGAR|nr:hypothetical protein C0989_000026 [Termitomyces sp. T132]